MNQNVVQERYDMPSEGVSDTFQTPQNKVQAGSSDNKTDSLEWDSSHTVFSELKGFAVDDIKSPTVDEALKRYELELLPGETLEEFMIRWVNRHKLPVQPSSSCGSGTKGLGMEYKISQSSYAKVVQTENKATKLQQGKVNFRFLKSEVNIEGVDACLPIESVRESCKRYSYTLCG